MRYVKALSLVIFLASVAQAAPEGPPATNLADAIRGLTEKLNHLYATPCPRDFTDAQREEFARQQQDRADAMIEELKHKDISQSFVVDDVVSSEKTEWLQKEKAGHAAVMTVFIPLSGPVSAGFRDLIATVRNDYDKRIAKATVDNAKPLEASKRERLEKINGTLPRPAAAFYLLGDDDMLKLHKKSTLSIKSKIRSMTVDTAVMHFAKEGGETVSWKYVSGIAVVLEPMH